MATLNRRPLANRTLQPSTLISPLKVSRTVSGSKRPRSPDPSADPSASHQLSKRVKAVPLSPAITVRDRQRERKHAEREQQRLEFREKYSRAFPGFIFYFEEDNIGPVDLDEYEDRIEQLGGVRSLVQHTVYPTS